MEFPSAIKQDDTPPTFCYCMQQHFFGSNMAFLIKTWFVFLNWLKITWVKGEVEWRLLSCTFNPSFKCILSLSVNYIVLVAHELCDHMFLSQSNVLLRVLSSLHNGHTNPVSPHSINLWHRYMPCFIHLYKSVIIKYIYRV